MAEGKYCTLNEVKKLQSNVETNYVIYRETRPHTAKIEHLLQTKKRKREGENVMSNFIYLKHF